MFNPRWTYSYWTVGSHETRVPPGHYSISAYLSARADPNASKSSTVVMAIYVQISIRMLQGFIIIIIVITCALPQKTQIAHGIRDSNPTLFMMLQH